MVERTVLLVFINRVRGTVAMSNEEESEGGGGAGSPCASGALDIGVRQDKVIQSLYVCI